MNLFLRSVLFSGTLLLSLRGVAQNTAYPYKVAQDLMLWHDNVDKEQQKFIIAGGGNDTLIRLAKDEAVNFQITDALLRRVDELQQHIEFDSTLNTNNKKKYLRALEILLRGFYQSYKAKDIQAAAAPALITAFDTAM